jgi:hypothetical protein
MTLSKQIRNESYQAEQPRLSKRQAEVLAYVQSCGFDGATRRQIADGTGLAINCVCGRVVELRKAGHLTESQTRTDAETGKRNCVLIAKEFDCGELERISGPALSVGQADGEAGTGDPGRTEGNDGQAIGREVQGFLFGS